MRGRDSWAGVTSWVCPWRPFSRKYLCFPRARLLQGNTQGPGHFNGVLVITELAAVLFPASLLQAMWLSKHLKSVFLSLENLMTKEYSSLAERARKHYQKMKVGVPPPPPPAPRRARMRYRQGLTEKREFLNKPHALVERVTGRGRGRPYRWRCSWCFG